MAKNDIKAGSAYVELLLKNNKFVSGLRASGQQLIAFAKGAAVVGASVGAAAIAVAGVGLKNFVSFGSELDDIRARTGMSVESLSELKHAAEMSGTGLGAVEKGAAKMQKTLTAAAGGSASAAEAFGALGLNFQDLAKMAPDQQFDAVANAVAGIADPTLRAGLAMQIFGKAGAELLPMVGDMGQLRQEARDLGLTMSGEAAASAAKLGDMFDTLWSSLKAGSIAIGAAIAPFVEMALPSIQTFVTRGVGLIQAGGAFMAANMGAVTSYIGNAWQSLVDFVGPLLGGYVATYAAYGKMLWEITQTAFNGIASIVGFVWGYIGDETSGTMTWLQNAVGSAMSTLTFLFTNWKVIAETAMVSAALSVVRFGNQSVYFFGTVIPGWLSWFGDNWRDVFTDIASVTATIASNIWRNLKNLWDAIVGLFNGEGFAFEWTPLTTGFESAIKELPKIAEREMGPLEESLQSQLDGLATDVMGKWNDREAEFKRQAAKFTPNGLGVPVFGEFGGAGPRGLGEAVAANVPSFGNSKKQVFAAFSGAALAAQGQGSSGSDKVVGAVDRLRDDLRQQHREMLGATKDGGTLNE